MSRKIAALPAMVTLRNLVCGFQAIRMAAQERYEVAAWLILAGMIFDALDGKVARLTKGASEFGAELDSLADVVTFGVAPAFLVAAMSKNERTAGMLDAISLNAIETPQPTTAMPRNIRMP